MKKGYYFLLIFSILITIFSFDVSANSGPYMSIGNDIHGVIPYENCPLEVKSEVLDITITDINDDEYNSSKIKASYEIYNPTNNDITVKLAYPVGNVDYHLYTDPMEALKDNEVMLDGNLIESTLRYEYSDEFDFDSNINNIMDCYNTDTVFDKDQIVYKYSFNIKCYEEYTYFEFNLANPNNAKIIGSEYINCEDDNQYRIYDKNSNIEIYSIGSPINISNEKLYLEVYDSDTDDYITTPIDFSLDKLNSNMKLYELTDLLFERYNMNSYDKFNIFTKAISKDITCINDYEYLSNINAWYLYEINVKANMTVTNSIKAPIFPDILFDYDPFVYKFTYLLSPSEKWASFKDVTVNIHTDFYLIDSNYEIEEIEGGYRISFDELLNRSLIFEICEVENPKTSLNPYVILFVVVIVVICVITLTPLILFIIYLVDQKKKDKPNKGLRKLLALDIVLYVYSFIFGAVIYQTFNMLAIVSIVLFLIAFILLFVEKKIFNTKILLRVILSIFGFLCILMMLLDEEATAYYRLEYAGFSAALFSLILVFFAFYYIIKAKKLKLDNKENDLSSYPNDYYGVGWVSNKHRILFLGSIVLILGIFMLSTFLFGDYIIINFIVFVVLLLLSIFIYSRVVFKPYNAFYKDLDIDKLVNYVNSLLDNPKIHPETKNFHLMNLCGQMIVFDEQKFKELDEKIFEPKFKGYKFNYHAKRLHYLLDYEKFIEVYKELFYQFNDNNAYKKHLNNFYNRWIIYYTGKCSGNIDTIVPYNTKNNINNASNLYIQIFYYYKNNDFIRAKELRDLFNSKYNKLSELYNKLNDLDL